MNKNNIVIDFIATNAKTKRTILVILYDLEFDGKNEYLIFLQDKLNSYLHIIETKEIQKYYENTKNNRGYEIRIVFKYMPNEECIKFLDLVKDFLKNEDIEFSYEVFS
ncbi:DUF6572 domain-containing protein [Pasteurella atlantica]|uniref:DUF6572 domain-containing protein n=1 Tax=Pasteurellaceae TaxID=712 RepID=UPI00274ABBC5|nr:DUF6572 domain-containing protein [Pasteurella atlantica]MDP8100095.1 hypothetical protein [Pasteurella atlantica]MDP8106222.1 hypothetical protein [Pasteurella atlantica]MDP8115951.1 hypothetical protein [Pasteurella atlantica]